jgi:hypothetical protein
LTKIFERHDIMPGILAASYLASTAGAVSWQTIVEFNALPGIRD